MKSHEGILYLLRSEKDGSLYLESTNNMSRRLCEHNEGKSSATRTRRPWVLWFAIRFHHISHARKAEQVVKAQKRRLDIVWILEILAKHLSNFQG